MRAPEADDSDDSDLSEEEEEAPENPNPGPMPIPVEEEAPENPNPGPMPIPVVAPVAPLPPPAPNRRYPARQRNTVIQYGRNIKQYVPLKPIKRGFKIWVVADSANGYFLSTVPYVGATEGSPWGEGCLAIDRAIPQQALPCVL